MKVKVISITAEDEPEPENVIVTTSSIMGEEQSPEPVILELTMLFPIEKATAFYIGQEMEIEFKYNK